MTEIDLVDGLVKEVRQALGGVKLRSSKGNQIPVNVYAQNLPAKEERDDEKMYPHVLVCFDGEQTDSAEDPVFADIYFFIGIIDREKDKQGFRDVLQIAGLIYQHIFRKGIVAGAFSPEYPYRVQLQDDDTYPYFYGLIESRWKLPAFEMEDKFI